MYGSLKIKDLNLNYVGGNIIIIITIAFKSKYQQ